METLVCIVCCPKASLNCSACQNACYCSKQHQTSHWKEHKSNCFGKAYQIEWDVNIGHHLVARKELEAGIKLHLKCLYCALNHISSFYFK